MQVIYEIDLNEKLACVTFPEKGSLKNTLEVMHTLAADERLEEGFCILIDVRAARFIPSTLEARTIATFASDQTTFLHYPTAMVVSGEAQYEAGTMISLVSHLKGAMVQVFYDVKEAREWLQSLRSKTQ